MRDWTGRRWIGLGLVLVSALAARAGAPAGLSAGGGMEWTQFGGPNRDFRSPSASLSLQWPEGGPKAVWSRSLGDGHSTILVDGDRLYTMYRPADLLSLIRYSHEEAVICLEAASGKTLWEHRYPSSTEGFNLQHGAGPHSTPLLVGDRLFATGSRKELMALDKNTGRSLWSRDLMKDYGAPLAGRGYICSPLAYKNTLIVTMGGSGQAVAAFNQSDGSLVWKSQSFDYSPASPRLIDVDGQEQLLIFAGDVIAGLDPGSGALLWSHPHKTDFGLNISTPVWGSDNLLLISSAYGSGTRLLRLSQQEGKTAVEEVWFQNRMRVHIGTVIRLGDFAVGSSGDFGPCPLAAIDLATGQVLWQDRGFARSMLLYADGKLVVLDEDGQLGLISATRQGMQVHARAQILENRAWTVPTLVGKRLYVRDRKTMAAYDLP